MQRQGTEGTECGKKRGCTTKYPSVLISHTPLITLSIRRVYIHTHYTAAASSFACLSFVSVIHNFYASFHVFPCKN